MKFKYETKRKVSLNTYEPFVGNVHMLQNKILLEGKLRSGTPKTKKS